MKHETVQWKRTLAFLSSIFLYSVHFLSKQLNLYIYKPCVTCMNVYLKSPTSHCVHNNHLIIIITFSSKFKKGYTTRCWHWTDFNRTIVNTSNLSLLWMLDGRLIHSVEQIFELNEESFPLAYRIESRLHNSRTNI